MDESTFAPQDPGGAEKKELVEKFNDAVIESSRRVADAYLANHQYSPWNANDLEELCGEYKGGPQYQAIFLEILSPYLNQMDEGRRINVERYLSALPAGLCQRLAARAVVAVAKDRGILGEENTDAATDFIACAEMFNSFFDEEPSIVEKKRVQYAKLKEKLGEARLKQLAELTLAGNATSWLIAANIDPIGSFSSEDIIELDREWKGSEEAANDDISNYANVIGMLRNHVDPTKYFNKISSSFLRKRFEAISAKPEEELLGLFENQNDRGRFINKSAVDITHLKAQKPPLDEYESGAEIGWGSASENFFE